MCIPFEMQFVNAKGLKVTLYPRSSQICWPFVFVLLLDYILGVAFYGIIVLAFMILSIKFPTCHHWERKRYKEVCHYLSSGFYFVWKILPSTLNCWKKAVENHPASLNCECQDISLNRYSSSKIGHRSLSGGLNGCSSCKLQVEKKIEGYTIIRKENKDKRIDLARIWQYSSGLLVLGVADTLKLIDHKLAFPQSHTPLEVETASPNVPLEGPWNLALMPQSWIINVYLHFSISKWLTERTMVWKDQPSIATHTKEIDKRLIGF